MLQGCGLSCNSREGPQALFDQAHQAFLHGELDRAQKQAELGYRRFQASSPEWASKFRILEAQSLLWRGLYVEALNLLNTSPTKPESQDSGIQILAIEGVAYARLHRFAEAQKRLDEAARMCQSPPETSCGDVLRSRGVLSVQQGDVETARKFFEQSLFFARTYNDAFLEETALLNLGATSLRVGHFDEAIDWSEDAYRAATKLGAEGEAQAALGNEGWAYYNLGDSEKSLELSLEAAKRATQAGDIVDELYWITNVGYVHASRGDLGSAKQSLLEALNLAAQINGREGIYNADRALALVSVERGELDEARKYADAAAAIAQKDNNHLDELYPLLVQGQVAARRGGFAEAEKTFQQVEHDPVCPIFLKWESQHWLARLYEDEKQPNEAVHEYQAALATFESARDTVRHEDFQLSFLTNAARIYDDYIHFLVSQGKSDEALRWADYSRARTLSEGLGLLSKGALKGEHAGPPPLRAQEISQRAKGTLLFYWLGEKQSYLWAITPHKTSLFPLPPGAEIDALVQRYRKAINGPQDVLTSSEEARALYRTLIVPAQSLLAHDGKVFIIPDGSLNNLNFETLVVPTPTEAKSGEAKLADSKPHFWIEDADVTNASSLRVLAASFSRDRVRANVHQKNPARKLLLIGDSVAPSKDYPELPRAAEQMASVSRHFSQAEQQVYQHKQATPAAYLASNPDQFSHIHFVAHGTASRLSPLDSAIVLSPAATDAGSFKLYARDIIAHPLQADLVTISACYGAGERAYSGEGLVGLAWAFLRAGAHNVIAGLWEVSDASTEQLMDRFYDELGKGASPDAALRTAKLSLLHNGTFRNPFYWAPFQLYTGS